VLRRDRGCFSATTRLFISPVEKIKPVEVERTTTQAALSFLQQKNSCFLKPKEHSNDY
jgi:hypothetical protein